MTERPTSVGAPPEVGRVISDGRGVLGVELGSTRIKAVLIGPDHAPNRIGARGWIRGVLWIEAFEATPVGTSLLDIRDNSLLTIHGEWWTDENGDGMKGAATATELQYFRDNYISKGWIVANGGTTPLHTWFSNGVIYMSAVPEPGSLTLVGIAMAISLGWIRRRK